MPLTSKTKGRILATVVFVAAAALYFGTLYKGFAPGASAHCVAMALGLESGASQTEVRRVESEATDLVSIRYGTVDRQKVTLRTFSTEFRTKHLVWRSLTRFVARNIPISDLPTRLNAMSAIFGALAVMLAFSLARGLILFINFHDSPVSSGNRKVSAAAAGIVAALALGLSTPFWLSATRCMPGAFDALLVVAMGWLLFSSAVSQRPRNLFAFGIICGVSLFELDCGIYIAILTFALAIRAMIVGGIMSIRSWCNCLVGIIVGTIGYIAASSFLLSLGSGSTLLPLRELMNSVSVANSLVFGGIFGDQARLASVFFIVLPFFATCALAMWPEADRNAAASGFLIFILLCTTFIAITRTPISPWSVYASTSPGATPVVIFVLAAAIASYLASAGAILARGRLVTFERKAKSRKEKDEISEESVGRLVFWFVAALCCVAGILNWGEVRDSKDTLIETTAKEFVNHLGGRTWMTSTTDALDTMVRITAAREHVPLRIVEHGGVFTTRLRNAIHRDEAFKGLPAETLETALASTNLDSFVVAWITHDPNVGSKLMLDAPQPWVTAGRTPVPAIIGYRALEKNEKVDWNTLADEHIAFWDAIEKGDQMLGKYASRHLRAERGELRAYLCGIGENLAKELGKAKNVPAEKMRIVYDKIGELREEPQPEVREEVFY